MLAPKGYIVHSGTSSVQELNLVTNEHNQNLAASERKIIL